MENPLWNKNIVQQRNSTAAEQLTEQNNVNYREFDWTKIDILNWRNFSKISYNDPR